MSNVIEFDAVWKKFKKGEKFNSIRDAVPNFFQKRLKEGGLKDLEFWAVKNVSFNIKKGEVVGIMGPNGAGKSTILKLLSKIIIPTKGEMRINGRLSALIEVTAGFHPELTGRETDEHRHYRGWSGAGCRPLTGPPSPPAFSATTHPGTERLRGGSLAAGGRGGRTSSPSHWSPLSRRTGPARTR